MQLNHFKFLWLIPFAWARLSAFTDVNARVLDCSTAGSITVNEVCTYPYIYSSAPQWACVSHSVAARSLLASVSKKRKAFSGDTFYFIESVSACPNLNEVPDSSSSLLGEAGPTCKSAVNPAQGISGIKDARRCPAVTQTTNAPRYTFEDSVSGIKNRPARGGRHCA